ncbi:MAG: hypothetical protein IJG84_10870 [Kiritimatiellae bacterium]|nr:hypothetical protein [Kiritimatiellia bacterium]
MPLLSDETVDSAAWREMWENPEADATVLNAMVLSKYGEEALDWDPLTIQMEIQDDFGVSPASEVMDKICAMQIVMGTGDFFGRVDAFRNVVNTIANGQPFFQTFTPLQAEEIAIAIATVGMNRDMIPFAPAVQELVRLSLNGDGYSEEQFPPILSCVFDRRPNEKAIREQLTDLVGRPEAELPTAAENNMANIDVMLRRRIVICLKQLDSLPGLTSVDDTILEKGVLRALNEDAEDR